ncbi:MAG: hypothetical protein QMC95_01525 [Desulfitobacteriaceae bacterium]|nr:hypothetical protein [Desulfitobacteriaceae bacterium]MDI6877778.1 hypothetical protein [Desulfitobacteriaceae bacterium]MDI6912883.1 hypothetical protein [Desulfitobacteriaceae bacterium]
MPNPWGRPPRNDLWQDLQTLAVWVLIIGVVGYLLFPNFFRDVVTRLTNPDAAQTATLGEVKLPNVSGQTNSNVSSGLDTSLNALGSSFLTGQDYNVAGTLYNSKPEITSGYWVIYVADAKFEQFALASDTYAFLGRMIESDQKAVPKEKIILAANGQIRQYEVSDEIYGIIINLATINARTHSS